MSRVVCIVQARLNSKRLPSKVLLPLNGHTVIGEVLTRCKRIPGVDDVVCAIPEIWGDNPLRIEAEKYSKVFCGPEDDVLKRYYLAADGFGADIIMRITGDCPLISPELCGSVLELIEFDNFVSNIGEPRTYPKGTDCEVFTRWLLEEAHAKATEANDREHVTPWMRREFGGMVLKNEWPIEGRLCIDTQDDYNVIKAYFDESRQHLHAA